MFILEPYIPSPQENHEYELWAKAECYRYYVEQRRVHCGFTELLDLWLLAPYCDTCTLADPLMRRHLPDIR